MVSFVRVDEAEILALFAEATVYGPFITLWTISVILILRRGETGFARRRLLPIGFLMAIIATSHILVDVVRLVQAFVTRRPPSGPVAFFDNVKNPLHTTKFALYVSQTLLGDGVLIWRCFIVWEKRLWVLSSLIVFWLAIACCGYAIPISLATSTPGTTVFSDTGINWITSFATLTAGINIICTSAISYRIWSTGTLSEWKGSASLWPIFVVVVETGMLYTAAILAFLISYLVDSNGQYIALDIMTQIVGVSFCLIVLQTQLRINAHPEVVTSMAFGNSNTHATSPEPPAESRGKEAPPAGLWTKNTARQTVVTVPGEEA